MDFQGPKKKPKEEFMIFEDDYDTFGLEEDEFLYLLDEEYEIEENDE
jgi:hypothetical protein